jgi:hypothetical protein
MMSQFIPPRHVPCLGQIDGIHDQTSRCSFVVIQQAAKPWTPTDVAIASKRDTLDQSIPDPLMIVSARRKFRSPNGIIRSSNSSPIDRTKHSAYALTFGA